MNELIVIGRTKIIGDARAHVVPALIAAAGEQASLRFLEFFAAAIRNLRPVRLRGTEKWRKATQKSYAEVRDGNPT